MSVQPLSSPLRSPGLLAAGLLIACSACDQRRPLVPQRIELTFLIVGTRGDDTTWQSVLAGAKRFTAGSSTLELQEKLPTSASPMAQKALLDAIGRESGYNAILMHAIDARVLTTSIRRVVDEGIPVVLIGDDARQSGRAAFVGANDEEVGVCIARTLAALCTEHHTLMLIHDKRGGDCLLKRYEGFTREVPRHIDLRVLREFDCQGDPAKVVRILLDTSERFSTLGGWALLDDWLGASAHPSGEPLVHGAAKIVAYGVNQPSLNLLEQGRVQALVGVDWEEVGYEAVRIGFQLLNHSAFPVVDIRASPVVVTRDTVDAFRKKARYPASSPSSQPAPAR